MSVVYTVQRAEVNEHTVFMFKQKVYKTKNRNIHKAMQ